MHSETSLQNSVLKEFNGKRIHILGVAGTLMGAFASFLKKNGFSVTGSDQNIYPPMSDVLKNAGVEIFSPFSAENLEKAKPDLVIVGNVIRKVNPEMQAVVEKNISYLSLPSAMEKMILPSKHPVVVAGTHGKTTTTSMLAWILEYLGEKPSFTIGGVVKDFQESFRVTDSKYMVLEGDEYDTAFFDKVPKFTHYCPQDVILTSVEYDHADIYPDMASVISAFDRLAKLVPQTGYFIVCSETETPLRIAHQTKGKVITYGFSLNTDSHASQIEMSSTHTKFTWTPHFLKNHGPYKVQLSLTGRHNVLNAMACLTLIALRDLNIEKAIEALKVFQGIKRRQDLYGEANGISIIDDFAHHPTAVRETLLAIRGKYPTRRIIACFEPRSATSRKKVFQQAYAEAFDEANLIFIAPTFQPTAQAGVAAQTASETFSTEELIGSLAKKNKKATILKTDEAGLNDLKKELKSGDVVLVMSNGSFDNLLPRLLKKLQGK